MTADNLNNMRVIPDLLAINEKVRPNKVAYRQFDDKSKTWISVTWKEFADMVRSWRKAFTASGLSKGDHAAVLLPNSITATACDLSILSQGMVPVPLHAVDTPSSSAFILNNSEAKILFVPRTLRWNAMLNAQKEYPYLKLVVTTGNDAEGASEDSPVLWSIFPIGSNREKTPTLKKSRLIPMTSLPSSTPQAPPVNRKASCSRTITF